MDSYVGEILAKLKAHGIDDNTIVFFTSDNGPQPGLWTDIFVDYFDGNGPYRGAKTNFYEGGIRVPFIVRWPGRIQPNSTSDFVGYFPDVMPTVAELAGAASFLPPKIDGISFVPTLLSRARDQKQHEYLYWEAAGTRQDIIQRAVRYGNWKAVQNRTGAFELYDLSTDVAEADNVAQQHPQVIAKIEAICREAHSPERAFGPAAREGAADYVR
jgi:arylsulfatase A-like enzyme